MPLLISEEVRAREELAMETSTDATSGTTTNVVVSLTNVAQGVVTTLNNDEEEEQAQQKQQQDVEAAIQANQQNSSSSSNSGGAAGSRGGLTKRRSLKDRFLTNSSNNNNTNNNKDDCSSSQDYNSNHNNSIAIPPATKAPKDTLKAVYAAGKYKAGLRLDVLMVQSTMAGIFIAFAGQLYLSVGGGVLGAALFPGGLIAVILTSAELFTGDALIFVASVLGGQVPLRSLLRNWTVSWCCNFVGSLVWAFFLGYLSDAVKDSGATELAIKVAEKKALDNMGSIFLKGVGANFLVCVAVWQGTCAEEVAGKVLALWWPTMSFILLGFSHCIANMYLIPMGMMLGADISVGRMFASLFMATLGNVVGGGIFVGGVYWYVFDSMASFGGLTSRIRQNMRSMAATRALQHAGSSSNGGIGSSWHPHGHPQPAHLPEPPSTEQNSASAV